MALHSPRSSPRLFVHPTWGYAFSVERFCFAFVVPLHPITTRTWCSTSWRHRLALSQLHDHLRSVLFGFICFVVLHRFDYYNYLVSSHVAFSVERFCFAFVVPLHPIERKSNHTSTCYLSQTSPYRTLPYYYLHFPTSKTQIGGRPPFFSVGSVLGKSRRAQNLKLRVSTSLDIPGLRLI